MSSPPPTSRHPQSPHIPDRRRALIGSLALASIAILSPSPLAIAADTDIATSDIPQAYQDTAWSLLEALRDAVDTDLSDAPEREVRRKADPAKDLVKSFMSRWRDDGSVKEDNSYKELTGAIKDLGSFYMKNGQRARLTSEAGQALLERLQRAELALPPKPEKKSLLPF